EKDRGGEQEDDRGEVVRFLRAARAAHGGKARACRDNLRYPWCRCDPHVTPFVIGADGPSPVRSMDSVRARLYFSAFHLACIDVSNFAQSTVLPRSASCSAAPMSSPPPDGSRSEPSKRTADAFAT